MLVIAAPQNFSGWNIAQLRYTSNRIDTMPDTM
jgi:hypothetical protein